MINIKNVNLGDVYYIVNKNYGGGIIKGIVIEISEVHETVLLKNIEPYGSGNCGAHVDELYISRREAKKSIRK